MILDLKDFLTENTPGSRELIYDSSDNKWYEDVDNQLKEYRFPDRMRAYIPTGQSRHIYNRSTQK